MARRIGLRGFVAGLATVIGLTACGADGAAQRDARRALLSDVENWVYIIDVNLDDDVVNRIADSDHDLVVLDFIESEAQNTDYPTAETVATLHDAENPKVVLAYIDIGEAEDYRSYWQNGWEIGDPDWILGADPDGWEGNYPVAFWRDNWQSIWLGDGQIAEIAAAGFDGIYLDWVEAYEDE